MDHSGPNPEDGAEPPERSDEASGVAWRPGNAAELAAASTRLGKGVVGGRTEEMPAAIAGYTIRGIIATGGQGVVYLAEQEQPRRTVALKVLKPGLSSRAIIRRFEHEAQILAQLRHPNIAQVFEAGKHYTSASVVPFFAMEYISGARTITEYARDNRLNVRSRFELFAPVCDAVQHGHASGIIHRDLKPANILVETEGQPKIIDFGVARVTDSDMAVATLQTDMGEILGTLPYMSPEQCETDPSALDARSDVYSLGVVLYELLCSRLPYDVTHLGIHEAARVIRDEPAMPPSQLDQTLAGDAETIVLKALHKDREERYASAADMAADIRRFVRQEPITARRRSTTYQLRLLVRRHRTAALISAVVALVLLVAAITGIALVTASVSKDFRIQELTDELEAERERHQSELDEFRQRLDALDGQGERVEPAPEGP